MKTAKDEVRELLDQSPDTASLEDIQYHLYVRQRVQLVLEAVERDEVVPQAEIERRMARWTGK